MLEKATITHEHQRLLDLVRYMRGHLLNEGLITILEYAALTDAGVNSAQRLADYDALRAENERLRTENEQLRAGNERLRASSAGLRRNTHCAGSREAGT